MSSHTSASRSDVVSVFRHLLSKVLCVCGKVLSNLPVLTRGTCSRGNSGFVAAGGGAAVFAGGAAVLLDTDAAADDFALLAISNTVEAIEGLPSPPPNNDPLDTCLAALANAPAGRDGTSLLLAPVGVLVVSAFTSSSPSITSGLQFSLVL